MSTTPPFSLKSSVMSACPKAMAPIGSAFCRAKLSLRCIPLLPTGWQASVLTLRETNTGATLSGPKGWNRSRFLKSSGVTSSSAISSSTFIEGTRCSSFIVSLTNFSKRARKEGRFSCFMVSPAANMCPPKLSSRSEHDSMAWYRS